MRAALAVSFRRLPSCRELLRPFVQLLRLQVLRLHCSDHQVLAGWSQWHYTARWCWLHVGAYPYRRQQHSLPCIGWLVVSGPPLGVSRG